MPLLLDLFLTYFKIGITTFGGGYAMIPLVQTYMMEKGWLTQLEVADFIAISEMTPGPFAINIATFCGIKTAGLPGAFASTLGVIMPSFIVILMIAIFFSKVYEKKTVQGALSGLRPAVVGLIATAAFTIGMGSYFPNGIGGIIDFKAILFTAIAFLAIKKLKINPIIAVLLSGVIGIFVYM